ncbi:hypothetical protein OHT57_09175 [Streptomyces sp. NBC_00285]|uniref:hypothetical protein n=1 Tax=Streptomyces sp. NBC_00285 TaxID=2975700 RepID=UPI002E2D9FCD|nr:hypothetical protein [Streptomyces sp. NBC_00285]
MNGKCTALGAALAAVLLALAPGATAVAADPSPLPTQAYASIDAEDQLNVGSAMEPATVSWSFADDGAQVPLPTNIVLVIDARGLAGVANLSVDDPRCKADGQVFTCVNKDVYQRQSVDFTLRAETGAALGDSGTITYTLTADHATGATAHTKAVVGAPRLAVGKLPDVADAKVGSRLDLPLRLRNTGNLATDRRIMLSWESVGGLVFDEKFSNCTYGGSSDSDDPGSQASVTCVFPVGPDSVPAGADVELSSPLSATVGKRVLTDVVDYSARLLKPNEQPGGGSRQGTGPALTLVRASGAGDGFEDGAEGRFTVSADNSADLASGATAKPGRKAGEWTLDLDAVNHGPASVYGIDNKSVAVVDVVLPKGAVVTGTAHDEEEDGPYGPCLLWVDDTRTAPFEAGHRHYVCTVQFGIAAGRSQDFQLWVKTAKGYDGATGTATVRPGPAGIPLHDPDASNDSVTFAFGTSAASPTPTTPATPADGALAATGAGHPAFVATASAGALLVGTALLLVRRRRRSL